MTPRQSSQSKEVWIKSLKKQGFKLTRPRKLILEMLGSETNPISADDFYLKIKNKYPTIGIATVYRTLELLSRLKLICKISLGSDKSFYTLSDNCQNEVSVYLICSRCGSVIVNNECLNNSIKIRLVNDAERHIFKNCRLKIDNFQIFFSGLCSKCSKVTKVE